MTRDDAVLRALLRQEGDRYVSDSEGLRSRLEEAMAAEDSYQDGPDAMLIELNVSRLRARPRRGQSRQSGRSRWVGAGLSAAAAAAVVAIAAGTFSLWAPRTRQPEATAGASPTATPSAAPTQSPSPSPTTSPTASAAASPTAHSTRSSASAGHTSRRPSPALSADTTTTSVDLINPTQRAWVVVGGRNDGQPVAMKAGSGTIGVAIRQTSGYEVPLLSAGDYWRMGARIAPGPFTIGWSGGLPEQDRWGDTSWAQVPDSTGWLRVHVPAGIQARTISLATGTIGGDLKVTAHLPSGATRTLSVPGNPNGQASMQVTLAVPASERGDISIDVMVVRLNGTSVAPAVGVAAVWAG